MTLLGKENFTNRTREQSGELATIIHRKDRTEATVTTKAAKGIDRFSLMMSWLSLLARLNRQVWLQAVGRGLYQAGGVGIIQFHAPIIFVNYFGLSATAVGVGVGSSSLAGAVGNVLGGILTDSQRFGRKGTLLLGTGLAALSCVVLTFAHDLLLFIVANLLVGLSLGLYWTAADTAIMDVTTPEDRHNGFAVSVVAESLGVGAGILGGEVLLNRMGNVSMLFAIGSLIFLVFLGLILTAIVETRQNHVQSDETTSGWLIALKDRRLLIFIAVNSLFVTYLALVNETMPLYFTNFLSLHDSDTTAGISASPVNIASLFTLCYVGLGAILQVPIASALGSWGWARPLMLSMGLWGLGFLLVWGMGGLASVPLPYKMGTLGLLGIATVIYRPFASTFLAEIAPETLRGVYTAMSYQCWAIGYFIGPLLGGWALDQSPTVAHNAWIIVALSTICGLIMLWMLARQNVSKQGESAC